MEENYGARWFDIGMLILRLGFGLGLTWFHGWGKLTGGPERWAQVGDSMRHVGIGFAPTFFGFLASAAEAIGGLLIAAGFLFRPAAVFVAFTMFVAWTMHVRTGVGTPAHAFKNLWVAVGLAFIGPGRYSVDHWLARRRARPTIELPTNE